MRLVHEQVIFILCTFILLLLHARSHSMYVLAHNYIWLVFPVPWSWCHFLMDAGVARRGTPFQSSRMGSCLTLGNELSEETHVLTKPEILLGKGTRVESRRGREPGRTSLPCGCCLGFYGDGISFRVVLSHSFWVSVLPGGAGLVLPKWMPERSILGGGWTGGVSF